MVTLRLFEPRDRAACLALFDGNAPPFFAPDERADFEEFLDHPPGAYLVVARGRDAVVACGGVTADPGTGLGELTWGLVARAEQGQGMGRFLLRARLLLLAEREKIAHLRLDTSQHTRGFFERAGFVARASTQDGYAPGLHRYEMALSLDPGRRARIRQDAVACGAAAAVAGLHVDLLRGAARRPSPVADDDPAGPGGGPGVRRRS